METGPDTGIDTGLPLREAALLLKITEKTLRKRIQAGDVRAWTVPGQRGLEWRVAVPEDRSSVNQDRSEDRNGDRPQDRPDTGLVIRLEMTEAALTEARARVGEERTRADREREAAREELGRVVAEVEFLRQQLQQRTDAERELRLLLASTQQAISAITQRPALEAATEKPRPSWWTRIWGSR